jgi:hypothetical protein
LTVKLKGTLRFVAVVAATAGMAAKATAAIAADARVRVKDFDRMVISS